jgi:hypothetical protein
MWFFENELETPAATPAVGRRSEIRCAGCGYDAVVARLPVRCPMCRSTGWWAPASGHSSFDDEIGSRNRST